MISIKNISFKVGTKTIIRNVNVDFQIGKLNLIIGPNGAGKSTLIKLICNQIKPSEGEIYLADKNIREYSIAELATFRAVLSQNIELSFPLKVQDVVMMGRYPHFNGKPTSKDEIVCEEAMRFFDVLNFADRNFDTLSGGEKQRVQFARVLSQIWYPIKENHRYLILDEPLTFLDIRYQYDFMNKISEILSTKDIVFVGVVHDLNLAARFADNIVLMNNGEIVKSGDKHDVLTKQNIKDVYELEPIIKYENNLMHLFF